TDQLERPVDEDLRLGSRNERAGIRRKDEPAETPLAEHVGERLAPLAAADERLERRGIDLLVLVDPRTRHAEHVCEQPLGVYARSLDAGGGEATLRLYERVANGHSPSARRRSSAINPSVNASRSPWRTRS